MISALGKMTFGGGVHPRENKYFTEDKPIELISPPKMLTVPLGQHIGAVCKPLVNKRDKVTAGQKIGESDSYVSSPVHSPLDGTVKDIALASHPVKGRELAVIIEIDAGTGNIIKPCPEKFDERFDEKTFTSEQICNAVRQCGLVGMGGAGFPTRVKIESDPSVPKNTLLINGCECEPFITCDYRVMLEWTWQVIAGVKLAQRAAGCERAVIAIEDNKLAAIEALSRAISKSTGADNISVCTVKTKYPQGGERQLIRAVLGKQVPTGGIPPMLGICVLNVATCAAIAEAVVLNRPLTHRVVTVTGCAISKPGNYYVPVGTSVGALIEYCGGLTERAARVVLGGPMMGFAIADMDTPITKTSGAVTFLTKEAVTKAKYQKRQTPCIRCGRCLTVCPENLNPTKIAHAVKCNMLDEAVKYYMSACIECGCCSYVCPANIELTGYIKTGKIKLAKDKQKA